jgi:Pao retrotransposon peptidase
VSNTAADASDLTYSEVTTCPFNVLCNEPFEHKVLGVVWETGKDDFVFKFEPVLAATGTESVFSKRGLLQIIARCFDPLGFVSPVIM